MPCRPGGPGLAPGMGMTLTGGDRAPRPARPAGAGSALGPCGERAPGVGIRSPGAGRAPGGSSLLHAPFPVFLPPNLSKTSFLC